MSEEGFPKCPEACGGMNAQLHNLTPDQLEVRARMGCDEECEGAFTITCPACNGEPPVGGECERCADSPKAGQALVKRCPRSFYSPDIGQALSAMKWAKAGVMPVDGGLLAQSSSFVKFCETFEGEVGIVRAEAEEERRIKAKRNPVKKA